MKFLMSLFDLRGLKIWRIIVALLINLLVMSFLFVGLNALLVQQGGWQDGMDISLMLWVFLASGLIGFGIAWLTRVERGISYAAWGSIGSFAVITVLMSESGLLALLVGFMALMGGYNGGLIGYRLNQKKQE
ncbi:MAG: hypothetical protein H0S82_05310 [Anaerolineaceae bacterium]|nr:hypothetical protein [Anaerolineaceae bacterium]